MDLQFKTYEGMFNCRVVGICIKDNKVLLSKLRTDEYWTFIGGKAMFGESTEEAVIRECKEELGVDIKIERLLTIAENFFEINEKKWHQYIFFYLIKDENNYFEFSKEEHEILDNKEVVYQWFDIEDFKMMNIKPNCAQSIVLDLPSKLLHIVNRDDNPHKIKAKDSFS